ncbi:LOW QUALITY PROTEIN: UPF0489 protein C5orf22 homolog [Amphiura filiformis]|uniref:LOW QUALITY PROTEIN: UPF0489 protein C5orf22 homolog n=1 Tax=Amphiura filiformis TaxID=82378 RepID=UPI003B227EAC
MRFSVVPEKNRSMFSMEPSTSNEKPLRVYKNLPVWVVEDHNDVLQHIYHAIASRHLPFSGMTMLHFDSHPDLQIATDMDADIVFNKAQLLSELSIENWIMPALYAGHMDHVIWVKPPWADQLPEGTRHVSVGKHKETGKLRVSWPDVYFLSDILYAPLDKLQNAKSVTIDTVTMETNILEASSFPNVAKSDIKSDLVSRSNDGYLPDTKRSKLDTEDGRECERNVELNKEKDSGNWCLQHTTIGQSPNDKETENKGDLDISARAVYQNQLMRNLNLPQNAGLMGIIWRACQKQLMSGHLEVISKLMGSSKPFILDVDLDFFSTKNPFKDVYTKKQLHLLEDLYSFTPPVDDTADALDHCQQKRAAQLHELESALKACWDGTEPLCAIDDKKLTKVKSLVSILQATPPPDDTLDAELIHMAGLTCDDTGELPHHVSTQEEIDSLIGAMKVLLSRLPKPSIVTISRSSHDDYCPPNQVESIQSKVLQMLESVYGSINVHNDYETPQQ